MNAQIVSSDQVLLRNYLQGDNEAISELIRRHNSSVRDYIRMMVKDASLADDICQETFIKAVRIIDEGRYVDSGRFLAWVMRIAHNRVIDYFRSQRQEHELNEQSAGYDILGSVRIAEDSVEERIVASQTEQELGSLIDSLPEEQRVVVRMRYYEGLSFREIAEQTNVSINTALGRMRYALINLRRLIKEKNIVLC